MMILINKAQANTVVLTLTEKATLSSPVFLFVFKNDHTKEQKAFIAADTSIYTERYNKFTITESSSESLLAGTVSLKPTGFWSYSVYEQSSSSNLDQINATSLLETGKVKVVGTATQYKEYNRQTSTYKVYGTGTT